MPDRQYFLICSNMRSGTTFLTLSLDGLADVDADYEFLFYPQRFAPSPRHMLIPHGYPARHLLEGIHGDAPIKGSKIVFGYHYKYGGDKAVIDDFIANLEGIKIIHIVRDYFDILVSKAGGFIFDADPNLRSSSISSGLRGADPARFGVTAGGQGASREAPDGVPSEQQLRVDLNLLLYGDILIHEICRRHQALRVNYTDISSRMTEIARFVGSRASEAEIAGLVDSPPTRPTRGGNKDDLGDWRRIKTLAEKFDARKWEILNSGKSLDEIVNLDGRSVGLPSPR